MINFVDIIITLPLLVMSYQFYFFSVASKGVERQERCQKLGIAYMTFGITALVFKTIPFVVFGLILIMLAFRLLAKGLDRLDKKIFIDQHEDDK